MNLTDITVARTIPHVPAQGLEKRIEELMTQLSLVISTGPKVSSVPFEVLD